MEILFFLFLEPNKWPEHFSISYLSSRCSAMLPETVAVVLIGQMSSSTSVVVETFEGSGGSGKIL